MKTLFPSASACLVVMFVATVGYAESQIDDASSPDREATVTNGSESTKESTPKVATPEKESANDGLAEEGASGNEPAADLAPEDADQEKPAEEVTTSKDAASGERGSDTRVSPSELSVAPLSHVTYPADRPSWIVSQPDLAGDVHSWVVTTSGYDTVEQCEDELKVLSKAAVSLYIKETTGWICGDDFVTDQWIEDDLINRRYLGTLEQGELELNEMAAELRFDEKARRRIQRARKEIVVNDRLKASGGLFALGLIGLCCTGGLLGVFSRRYG